jgi:hypothetical protein
MAFFSARIFQSFSAGDLPGGLLRGQRCGRRGPSASGVRARTAPRGLAARVATSFTTIFFGRLLYHASTKRLLPF